MHVGLDLDNTLIDYDAAFGTVAVELGMLSPSAATLSKRQVRALLRAQEDGEQTWMRLQGQVYGAYLSRARLFQGAKTCLQKARALGANLSVVSHKTRYGHFDESRTSLWQAALDWLEANGAFSPDGLGLDRESVYFEETRERKIARIDAIACDVFIDDLPEVLLDSKFPVQTRPVWFANGAVAEAGCGLPAYDTWYEIERWLNTSLVDVSEHG